MKVTVIVAPPGGGQAEYNFDFDLPAVPGADEYLTVARDDMLANPQRREAGDFGIDECFYVRRVWWDLRYPHSRPTSTEGDIGSAYMIAVEAEVARGPHMTAEHQKASGIYEHKGLKVRTFDNSAY